MSTIWRWCISTLDITDDKTQKTIFCIEKKGGGMCHTVLFRKRDPNPNHCFWLCDTRSVSVILLSCAPPSTISSVCVTLTANVPLVNNTCLVNGDTIWSVLLNQPSTWCFFLKTSFKHVFILLYFLSVFIFIRITKRRGPREGKCHVKTMMNTKVNERLK